jgi:hypothetical protein
MHLAMAGAMVDINILIYKHQRVRMHVVILSYNYDAYAIFEFIGKEFEAKDKN